MYTMYRPGRKERRGATAVVGVRGARERDVYGTRAACLSQHGRSFFEIKTLESQVQTSQR